MLVIVESIVLVYVPSSIGKNKKNIRLKKIKKIIKFGYNLLNLLKKYSNKSKLFLLFLKIACVITYPDNIKNTSTPI